MLTLKTYRSHARQLVEHACNGATGRPESDPVYQRVTEGRDVGAAQRGYSSCGDLPAWLWFRLGVRSSFVNRRENARYGWRVGLNIALLSGESVAGKSQGLPTSGRRTPTPESRFDCGDVLVVWNKDDSSDAHTLVVLEHMDGSLLSGDYGQPGAALKTRAITQREVFDGVGARSVKLYLGSKQIRRWAPLDLVIAEAQRRGELVEPDLSELERVPDTDRAPPPASVLDRRPTLREGDRAPVVAEMQHLLNAAGAVPMLLVDQHFGPATREGLKAFQARRGLKADGVCGPMTWSALLEGQP